MPTQFKPEPNLPSKPERPDDRLLTVAEAARDLGISRDLVPRLSRMAPGGRVMPEGRAQWPLINVSAIRRAFPLVVAPSESRVAAALGVARSTLQGHLNRHPGHPAIWRLPPDPKTGTGRSGRTCLDVLRLEEILPEHYKPQLRAAWEALGLANREQQLSR